MLWIDASGLRPPPPTPVPTILLAPPDGSAAERAGGEPAVWLPVGTAGLDHAGDLYRTDRVVALRARALRRTGLASVAELLGALAERLPDHPA